MHKDNESQGRLRIQGEDAHFPGYKYTRLGHRLRDLQCCKAGQLIGSDGGQGPDIARTIGKVLRELSMRCWSSLLCKIAVRQIDSHILTGPSIVGQLLVQR